MRTRPHLGLYARIAEVSVEKYADSTTGSELDLVAVEDPLEIHITHHQNGTQVKEILSITMRTPGDDKALALGFLFAEGIISSLDDVSHIEEVAVHSRDKPFTAILSVALQPHVDFDLPSQQRHFFSSSSCGVCGRLTLNNLPPPDKQQTDFHIDADIIYHLTERVKTSQTLFHHTGGIHAAALFDRTGNLIHLSEDVGRHNAMDKLIGSMLVQNNKVPFNEHILLFSGRVSYELMQKAVVAGISVITAIGAPSSLAVEIAGTYNITLIGFLRDRRFNVYAGGERIRRT